MKLITHSELYVSDLPYASIFLVHNNELYTLMSEQEGYIFRPVERPQFGHTGHHDSKREACRVADGMNGTRIYVE